MNPSEVAYVVIYNGYSSGTAGGRDDGHAVLKAQLFSASEKDRAEELASRWQSPPECAILREIKDPNQ